MAVGWWLLSYRQCAVGESEKQGAASIRERGEGKESRSEPGGKDEGGLVTLRRERSPIVHDG